MRRVALSVLFLSPFPLGAQPSVADVSAAQVAAYKVKLEEGCVRDAVQGGMESAKARSFCGCTTTYARENMPDTEWQSAAYQDARSGEKEALRVLVPYIRKAALAC